jgi:dUTP pyrophosphatase
MPNSVGVIDPTYTGTLKIPAMKVDKSVPDLCPPFTKFQLVMRPAILFEMEETKEFGETVRGSGGFGSSG